MEFFPRGSSAVNHLGGIERPDLVFEIAGRDFGDCIRLFHVGAELCEYLVEGNTDTHGQPKFLTDSLSDLFGYCHRVTAYTAACDIKPALVHAEGFNKVCVPLIDSAGKLGVL